MNSLKTDGKSNALTFIAVILMIAPGCGREKTERVVRQSSLSTNTGTVKVVIQANGSHTDFTVDGVEHGATVESVMRKIDSLDITITGTGLTAFVSEIDGLATSPVEGWLYEIDGEHASKGIGSTTINPPATVTWKFGEFTPP